MPLIRSLELTSSIQVQGEALYLTFRAHRNGRPARISSIPDKRRPTRTPSAPDTCASTKAGAGPTFVSDVLFAKGAHLLALDGPAS